MTGPVDQKPVVAIIGCGQIADAHLQELRKIKSATIAATCDVHLDLAMQAARRFDVPHHYSDVQEMLRLERPDIVHIATPVQSHAPLAIEVLRAGAHVYIEKPLALNEAQAREILAVAQSVGRGVCVGHDQLFDPAWLELRRRVDLGEIGEVRHVDSMLGYPLSAQFGKAVQSDETHWVRQLPGGLFQNTISHPLYRITEFLTDERPRLVARWWSRPGFAFPSEMFAQLRGHHVTANLTFSTTVAAQRITRVYGTKGMLDVDLDAQTVCLSAPASLPGAFGKLDAAWRRRREGSKAWWRNAKRFAKSDIHYFAGMRGLFERFQLSIRHPVDEGGLPTWPIAPAEMLRVTRIMDEIFDSCRAAESVARDEPVGGDNVAHLPGVAEAATGPSP